MEKLFRAFSAERDSDNAAALRDFFLYILLNQAITLNFENRSAFGKVRGKNVVAPFFRTRLLFVIAIIVRFQWKEVFKY